MVPIISWLIIAVFALNLVAYLILLIRSRRYLLYQGESRVGLYDGGFDHLRRASYRQEGWPLVVGMQAILVVHLLLAPLALYAVVELMH